MAELQAGGEAGVLTRAVSLSEAVLGGSRETLMGLLCKRAKGRNENKQQGAGIYFQIRKCFFKKLLP